MRWTTLLTGVVFLLPASSMPARAAGSPTISIPASSAGVGAEVKVPIRVEGAADLGAIEMSLVYDAQTLEFVSLEAGPLNTGLVESNLVRPGLLRIGSIAEPGLSGSGDLFTLAFRTLRPGTAGFDLTNARFNAGSTGAEINVSLKAGALTVSSGSSAGESLSGIPFLTAGLIVLVVVLILAVIGLSIWVGYLLGRKSGTS